MSQYLIAVTRISHGSRSVAFFDTIDSALYTESTWFNDHDDWATDAYYRLVDGEWQAIPQREIRDTGDRLREKVDRDARERERSRGKEYRVELVGPEGLTDVPLRESYSTESEAADRAKDLRAIGHNAWVIER